MSIIINIFLLPFSDNILLLNRYVSRIFCLTNSFQMQRYWNRTRSLDSKQNWLSLICYIQVVWLLRVMPYVHMPRILQQVALGPGRLLTTYVTSLYTSYNWTIDDLDRLEIVEVAYGGLAAGRGVIWLTIRLWVSVLGVKIRNCDNQVISFMDIRPSVKSMCLLWCLCIVQIIKSTVVISIEYRSLSAD
jgi:hypothetical protein